MFGLGGQEAGRLERLPLQPLRTELRLHQGPATHDGSPSWSLHDPVQNKFFRIGWAEFEMLSRWSVGNDVELVTKIALETPIAVTREMVKNFSEFLSTHNLLTSEGAAARQMMMGKKAMQRSLPISARVKKLMFIKVPLLRPQKFLQKTFPAIRWMYSQWFFTLTVVVGILGLYLTARQWDLFMSQAGQLFTPQGAALTAVTLVFVKTIHELSHAYTAHRLGCYIPSMGVAFMVFWPILYTDVSDSWKLRSKYQRLIIGAAGVIAEFYMAAFATFLWAFLPPGTWKTATFFIATVSWTMSVLVNLNPLMRFDGYFMMGDFLAIDNLGARSNALALWSFRRFIFGLDDAPPERFPIKLQRALIIYGYAVWVYRFFLYLGIAVMVYHMAFKVLGLAMMLFEIVFFIIVPVIEEGKKMWKIRDKLSWNRQTRRAVAILILLGGIVMFPWHSRLEAPGMIQSSAYSRLFAPVPARVEKVLVQPGDKVTKGQPLVLLYSPQLMYEVDQTDIEATKLRKQLEQQQLAQYSSGLEDVLEEDLGAAVTKLSGLMEQQRDLTLRSGIDGKVVQLASNLHELRWVDTSIPLVMVADESEHEITAYISEDSLALLDSAKGGMFYPDLPELAPFRVDVIEIAKINSKTIGHPALASTFGGPILSEAQRDEQGHSIPVESIYQLTLAPTEQGQAYGREVRGRVRFEGERQSLFTKAKQAALQVLVRESGF